MWGAWKRAVRFEAVSCRRGFRMRWVGGGARGLRGAGVRWGVSPMLTRRSASYSRWGGREGYVERCEVGSISYADSSLCVLQ